MYKRGIMRRNLSMILTAVMLVTALPETGIHVEAARSSTLEILQTNEKNVEVEGNVAISSNDVGDGDLLPGDVSNGDETSGTVSGGNVPDEEDNGSIFLSENVVGGDCGAEGNNVKWSLDLETGILTVNGSGIMKDYYEGSAPWYSQYKESIKKVIIEDGITTIGEYAFYGLANLTVVSIGKDVKAIDEGAFYETSLNQIDGNEEGYFRLPDTVEKLRVKAFGKTKFEDIYLGGNLISIHEDTFSGCNLNSIRLEKDLENIYSRYQGVRDTEFSINTLYLGKYVTYSWWSSFKYRNVVDENESGAESSLHGIFEKTPKNIIVDEQNEEMFAINNMLCTKIGKETYLVRVYPGCIWNGFPENITIIGSSAFSSTNIIEGKLIIPDTISRIESNAFGGCNEITEVVLPAKLTYLGDTAFYHCNSLKKINIPRSLENNKGQGCFDGTKLEEIVFEEGTEKIAPVMFALCGVENLVLPNSIKEIGNYSFNRSKLKSIKLNEGLEKIGYMSLNGTSITSIEIPSTVKQISAYAFNYCNLDEIIFKTKDVEINSSANINSKLIVGYKNSTAQAYATEHNIPFMDIDTYYNQERRCQVSNNVGVIRVFDKSTNKTIQTATVTDGTNTYTGTELIEIPMTDSVIDKKFTISADGYYTVEKNVTLKKGEVTYISLPKKNSDSAAVILDITGIYNNKMYDFMSQSFNMAYIPNVETLSDLTYGNVDIIVNASGNIKKYELVQNNKVIQSNTDGRFSVKIVSKAGNTTYTSPVTTELVNGKKVYVRITDNADNQVEEALSINVSKSYTSNETVKQTGKFEIGESIKVQVPDDVPLLGGGTLEIGLKKEALPIELSIEEDGTVRFALNKKTASSMDEFEEDYKKLVGRAKGLGNAAKAFGGTPSNFGGGFFNVKGKIYGYGEGNISELDQGNITLKVGIYAEIEGKGGYKQYFFVGYVPLNIFVEGSVTAKPELEATLTVQDYKITDFDFTGGSFNAKIALTAGAGVGVGLEVNASITGNANYTWKPARDYQKVWLDASGKVSVVVGWFEKDLWKSKKYNKVLYESGTDKNKVPLIVNSDLENVNDVDCDSFQPMSRNYLFNQSGYQAFVSNNEVENVNTDVVKKQVIKAAVYPSAAPRLVSSGEKQYLFWMEDIITRSANNRSALVYSVSYDGNKWSEPVQLISESEDSTPDLGYDVFADNSNIYIVWQDGTKELEEDANVVDMVSSLSIKYATMNTKTGHITVSDSLTDRAAYYMYPQIMVNGNDIYVAYVENLLDDESIVGNNTHKLFCSVNGEVKELTLPKGYQIVNMDLGKFSNGLYAICEMDIDGDLKTEADRELFAFDLKTGSSTRLTDNEVADFYPVLSETGNLYWNYQSEIHVLDSIHGESAVVMNEERFSNVAVFNVVTTAEGKDWILFENADWDVNGTLAVYGIEQISAGEYEGVVKLTDIGGGIASKVTAIHKGEELIVGLLEGDFLEDGTILKDLCLYHVGENTDITVTEVYYDESQVIAGTTLPLQVCCYNNGNTTIQNAEISVDDTVVANLSGLDLKPMESRELTIEGYVVPEGITEPRECILNITVSEDSNVLNNESKFYIGLPDVNVKVSTRQLEGHYWLDMIVNNKTDFVTSGTIKVYKNCIGGEIIYEDRFTNLIQGTAMAYTMPLENYETECKSYYVEVISDELENNIGDNSTLVYIGFGSGIDIIAEDEPKEELTSFVLDESEVSLVEGEEWYFSICTEPENIVDNSQFLWTSSNPKVVTIDDKGVATALSAGTAVISAHYGELSAECIVYVEAEEESSITIFFNTQTSQRIAPVTGVTAGSTITFPEVDILPDLYFIGWFTEADGGEFISEDYVFKKSMTLYAHWSDTPNGFWVKDIPDVSYTGKAVKPQIYVYDERVLLTEGKDYTISYANNTIVAGKSSTKAPKVTITGKGNYKGKVVKTFNILPYDITSGGVKVTIPEQMIVNGRIQLPVPQVTYLGKKLTVKKDYVINYPDLSNAEAYKNEGTYKVEVNFINNFTGAKEFEVAYVTGTPISKVKIDAIAKQAYTGDSVEPKPNIKNGDRILEEGTDYRLLYVNNVLPGKATIRVIGMGSYVGEKTITFEITGTPIAKAQVTGIEDKIYNGKIQTQKVNVSLDKGLNYLVEDEDYKITYEKNMNTGTAKMRIVGINGYTGSITKSFKILPYNLRDDAKLLTNLPKNLVVPYMKGGVKPEFTFYFNGYVMNQKKDCSVSYVNNAKTGTANDDKAPGIVIKGKGNFTGTIIIPFTIIQSDLGAENATVKMTVADVAYINKPGKYVSVPILMDANGKKLVAGTDYEKEIVYKSGYNAYNELNPKKNIIPAGWNVTVQVKGKGFYKGTITATYRITNLSFNTAKVTIRKKNYTGKPVELSPEDITVMVGKTPLVYGKDYEIVEDSYKNNIDKGSASVTIRGINDYGGTKTVKFVIDPKEIY